MDRVERQYQLQSIVEQPERAEPLIPRRGSFVFCVDGERHATRLLSHGERTFAGGKKKIAAATKVLPPPLS